MRRSLVLVPFFLALASCSGGGREGDSDEAGSGDSGFVSNDASAEVDLSDRAPGAASRESSAAGPDVSPTAAPGVAFNYRYAFRLAAERVAEVQEQHAARCEQLGPNRCRITGMLYRRHDEDNIEARLAFKLDPSVARAFGREGVGAVVRADGMLVENEISGTDMAPTIRQAGRGIAEIREELARIEARLAGRLSAGDRANLEYEAQQLRARIRATEQNRNEAEESLATTPMTFVYGSGRYVPGPQPRRPVGEVVEEAWENFLDGASILFVIVVTLLPWALLAGLGWLAWRAVRRRFGPRPVLAAGAEEPA
jgi:hypothetical protein